MNPDARALALFTQVADAAPSQRAALLAGEAPAVRQRLEEMLAAEAEELTLGLQGLVGPELVPPQVVGDFTLLGLLGEGGMGMVWLAEQALPRRRVAVKLLRPQLFGPDATAAFHAEIETLAMLCHPGLPALFAAGETAGWHWLAMEHIDGLPLAAWAEHAEPEARRGALVALAEVVALAHERGVVHRDLKPANILVAPRGVVVLDFGIARVAGAVGIGAGTPGWQAPEQVGGAVVDPRADVYALGRLGQLLLGPESPDRALLDRATATDPAARPADARAFLEGLDAAPTAAPLRWVERGGSSEAEQVLLRLVEQVDPRGGDLDLPQALRQLSLDLDRGALTRDPAAEARLRLLLIQSFDTLGSLSDRARQAAAALALIPALDDPILRGRIHGWAAETARQGGRLDEAEEHILRADALLPADHPNRLDFEGVRGWMAFGRGDLDEAERAFRASCSVERPSLRSLGLLATILGKRGKTEEARSIGRSVLARQSALRGPRHLDVAVAWSKLGQISSDAGEPEQAVLEFKEELDILLEVVGPAHIRTTSCRKWLAGTLSRLGRLDEALAHIETAIAHQADEPYLGSSWFTLAGVLLARGELPEAEAAARRATTLYLERLGEGFRELPRARALLGEILLARGELDEARALLAEALPRLRAMWGPTSPRLRGPERAWAALQGEPEADSKGPDPEGAGPGAGSGA